MSQDFNVIGYYLSSNMDLELHNHEELEHLAKKKVINRNILQYNKKLNSYLDQFKVKDREGQAFKAKYKKLIKDLNKIDQLNQIDRISIVNNKFANESELILKIKNCENITPKQRKMILQNQL